MSAPEDEERPDPIEDLVAALHLDEFDPTNRRGLSSALGAQPVNWRNLTDEEAAEQWRELRGWVEWFTTRYDIPEVLVPACWWRHGALVEELSALHTAWDASFDATDAGFGPVGWHERLAVARARLKAAYPGSCISGHQDRKPRSWSGRTNEQEWDAWIAQTHAR